MNLHRWALIDTLIRKAAGDCLQSYAFHTKHWALPDLLPVLPALRDDYAAGRVRAVQEIIHADTFAHFLGMAEELFERAYTHAAAVIAGTTLEVHLRALCARHQLSTTLPDGHAKKASALNAELAGVQAYEKGDQK